MNQNQTRVRFKKKKKKLVSTDVPNLWKTFKDVVLKACDEMSKKNKSRRDRGDMWWWNEEIKDTKARKVAFKDLCRFSTEENKTKYKRLRHQMRKIVAKATRMKANQQLNNLYQDSIRVINFLRRMKKRGIWKEKGA